MNAEEEQLNGRSFAEEGKHTQHTSHVILTALSNPAHPEYGFVRVHFPIQDGEHDHVLEQMAALQIGDPLKRDCHIGKVDSAYQYLGSLQNSIVTLDELDYLAKRLDSFSPDEGTQFQAMAYKLGLTDIKDLIDLTFCCQKATVITDFTDLAAAGRQHYMNLHSGVTSTEVHDGLVGEDTAVQLIRSGDGVVTPYGVVYQNSMELEPVYNGRQFPAYVYDSCPIMLEVTPKHGLAEGQNPEYIYLPAPMRQIERTMIRAGIQGAGDIALCIEYSELPERISDALDLYSVSGDDIAGLNQLCYAVKGLNGSEVQKVNAAVAATHVGGIGPVNRLLENLDQFDFLPDVYTAEEYGKYMIQRSGHFSYDENLEPFYDYRQYGEQHVKEHDGCFTEYGYIVYRGVQPLKELLNSQPSESYGTCPGLQIGGI